LITTKSGNVHAKDVHDWRIQWPEVTKELERCHNDGYKLVIFSNQKGIQKGCVDSTGFKKKIQSIVTELGVPIQVSLRIVFEAIIAIV
jgi:bifunctional polynucleotide phosphatase/kinase